MNRESVFPVEKDAFATEADIEEGIDEKWLKLAKETVNEDPHSK